MSKYVIDTDRFIPEIKELFAFGLCVDDTITTPSNIRHIGEPLTPEYINEHFSDLHEGEYEVAYQKGLDDAWEAARKIDGMTGNERHDCFGIAGKAFKVTAFEAIKMIAEYEERKKDDEIKVGDEIEDYDGSKYVVEYIDLSENCIYAVRNDGHTFGFHGNHVCKVKKTGRHFPEVAELLKKMKGGE